jgi:hypothetical protein
MTKPDKYRSLILLNERELAWEMVEDFSVALYRLDLFHNRVTRHWQANCLYILLTEGKQILEEHRRFEGEL